MNNEDLEKWFEQKLAGLEAQVKEHTEVLTAHQEICEKIADKVQTHNDYLKKHHDTIGKLIKAVRSKDKIQYRKAVIGA